MNPRLAPPTFASLDEVQQAVLVHLVSTGTDTAPRGLSTLEGRAISFTLKSQAPMRSASGAEVEFTTRDRRTVLASIRSDMCRCVNVLRPELEGLR
jgi:hypothetical protein